MSETPRTGAMMECTISAKDAYGDAKAWAEHCDKLQRALAAARERVRELETACKFAQGAIEDAIYTEDGDGIDGDLGQRIIHILVEAIEDGTFDKRPFYGPAPPFVFEQERDRAEKAESERDALKPDAERYRWLRDEAPAGTGDMASVRDSHGADEIDAAIDAAREQP